MILFLIIIILVLAIAFFHYTQGLFSATLSAMCTILAAVLAFSYHEVIVQTLLGGRFPNTAHAMVLAVLFAAIYIILRVMFDKMVPGNLRLPVVLDKAGAAAMGLVAGVFAGGILAIAIQYLPMRPSIAGYARYAVDTRTVIVPPEATGRQSLDSEVWDQLKSGAPGEYEEADRQTMIVPMDDIVVNTVNHLSDGGSLGWNRLADVHPNFLDELFGQRLGTQPGATRVAMQSAVASADLFRVDALQQKDHEYKEMRTTPLEGTQLKPKQNEMLLVLRLKLTRNATDKDGVVRFSPASVRLVGRKGTGGDATWVNYYPVGTVDAAKTLYSNSMDDYLFVKGSDAAVDLAFLVGKDGFTDGPNSMQVAEGTFVEFKRMARLDLDKEIKPPTAYKPAPNVQVLRKRQAAPEAAQPQQQQAANPADALKAKLIGNWMSTSDAGQLILEFMEDGSLKFNNTPKSGLPQIGQGTWAVVPDKTTADALVITRTVNGATAESTVKFTDDNNATLERQGTPTLTLQRRS